MAAIVLKVGGGWYTLKLCICAPRCLTSCHLHCPSLYTLDLVFLYKVGGNADGARRAVLPPTLSIKITVSNEIHVYTVVEIEYSRNTTYTDTEFAVHRRRG